jgi:hypothetical protein
VPAFNSEFAFFFSLQTVAPLQLTLAKDMRPRTSSSLVQPAVIEEMDFQDHLLIQYVGYAGLARDHLLILALEIFRASERGS